MSKLTKIVLINWMFFQKVTLPIEGNTAIVGVNGSGKSTIIDAIQMLLLGQRDSKFNSGTNAEKRTLESYVRGHIAAEDKDFLRPNDVVTYIALEVETGKDKHIFGINIEYKVNQNKLMDPKYFYLKNLELTDDLFVTDKNYPKTYDVFSKEMRNIGAFIPFQTLHMYQNKIKEIFGLKSESSYFRILSRAIGLKNISECNKFMNEFVLDEQTIDLSDIKNNILEMNKASKTIERERYKKDALNEICLLGDQITQNFETIEKNEITANVATKIMLDGNISNLEHSNSKLDLDIEVEEKNKIELREVENLLQSKKDEYIKALDNIAPNLSQMKIDYDALNKQHDEISITKNSFKTKCENELFRIKNLKKYNNIIFNTFYSSLKEFEFSSTEAKQLFIGFRDEANKVCDPYKKTYSNNIAKLEEYKNSLEELRLKITGLKNNEPVFRRDYLEFKNYIADGLKNKYNEEIEVKFLCEYLDIKDDTWRNAIEGYLGNQKFYLIVPPRYYKDALRLYETNSKLHSTRLINGNKLPEFDSKENTLGEFIIASNSTALNYARYILNRVNCAKDSFDLDNYEIAITKECMCYQNYSSWRINPKNYRESFIGQEGLKNQLKFVEEKYKELNDEAIKFVNYQREIKDTIDELNSVNSFAQKVLDDNNIQCIDDEQNLFTKIEQLKQKIEFFTSNPEYLEINSEITKIEKQIEEVMNKIEECDHRIVDFNNSKLQNNFKISGYRDMLIELEEKINEYDPLDINQRYLMLDKIKINDSYINKIKKDNNSLEITNTREITNLEHLMTMCRNDYMINLEPKYNFLNAYKQEKNKINEGILIYENKLIEMQKSHRKLFFSEFLSKLNNSIELAKDTIKNLNASLETFTFGNDFYKIKSSITDNQDLKAIYEYAKEYNSENSDRGLFVDRDVEDTRRQKIEQLINDYMFSEDNKTQNIIVDYRNYLYFDVEVHTPVGIKSLNKVIRSQSGGEVQVPFYILSGVAFKQTLDYKRNKDSIGIVLYDEAFDKMDSQRIQAMLQFYNDKLGLQLIIAAPGKLDSLVENVDTILAIVRSGENAIVSDITHENR